MSNKREINASHALAILALPDGGDGIAEGIARLLGGILVRSLEILSGSNPALVVSEIEMEDLFARYRSPWRA